MFFDLLDLGSLGVFVFRPWILGVGLWNLDFAYREVRLDFGSWCLILAVWYPYWIWDLIFFDFLDLGSLGVFLFRPCIFECWVVELGFCL